MTSRAVKTVRPDSKGRITLGTLAKGISSFTISQDEHNRIILEPFVEIPVREQWLLKNKKALNQIKQGLKDAAEGRLKKRGSFAKYKDEELD